MEVFNISPISEIAEVPGLCISDITIPQSTELLRKHGITHVVSLTNQRNRPIIAEELGIEQIHLDIEDNPFEDLLMSLEGLCAWIENAIVSTSHAGGSLGDQTGTTAEEPAVDHRVQGQEPDTTAPPTSKVLVHCLQGMSRSGAVIVAYLMWKHSLDFESALELARQSRPVITPNSGFADQLRLWYKIEFSIYATPQNVDEDAMESTKPEYEEWRSNRGILLSKGQEEKQKIVMKSMADMAARFGQRRLQMKSKGSPTE